MGRLALIGVVLVAMAELVVLAVDRRNFVALVSGLAVAVVLIVYRLWLDDTTVAGDEVDPTPTEALDRWHARTEVMISWADGTRGDWNRHLRPLVAQEFQMSTGHKLSKDPVALNASGRMLFGNDLWQWVDPSVVSGPDRDEPGPGRDSLDEILRRLETL